MIHVVTLPDIGEGVAEAELVDWLVAVGDAVTSDSPVAQVLTDKATVEIYSPVTGTVAVLHGEPGDTLAVGGQLISVELDEASSPESPQPPASAPPASSPSVSPPSVSATPTPTARRPTASPAVRARARGLGIDLGELRGSGPDGRIEHGDLDQLLSGAAPPMSTRDEVTVEAVRGLRRAIAERLTTTWRDTPHITYVEQVDATGLLALRDALIEREPEAPRLTPLPFVIRAVVAAVADQPRLNAHYSPSDSTLSMFDAVHVGVATQTPSGLVVPVLRHAEGRDLHDVAAEVARLAASAREGTATRDELSGSTITVTSLGALGGLVTTPILNSPEVAIIGINRLDTRAVWSDIERRFVPRQVFNISASFDHRIVDGWDAATFVQRLRALLETPAIS